MKTSFGEDTGIVVKAIQDSVKAEKLIVGDKEFVTREVFLPPEKSETGAIKIHSLEGLAEYLNAKVDGHEAKDLVVIINSERSVSVLRQVETSKDIRT